MNQDKMPCRYDTFRDLNDRLEGSIVLYKDFPYYCAVRPDPTNLAVGNLFLVRMDEYDGRNVSTKAIQIKVDDPDLDISSVDLGYVNYESTSGNSVYYLYRTTAKRFKQALYPAYISYKTIDGVDSSAGVVWNSRSGFDILVDLYPSLSTALERLDRRGEVAISRDVAIKKVGSGPMFVYLRTKEVAWIDSRNLEMVFSHESDWVDRKYVLRFPWERNGIHAKQ